MSKPTLILVDDTTGVTDDLQKVLSADFEVVGVASSGEEAIALCNSLNPDLVLMDLVMPVMSGLEATRQIKVVKPQIQVVILSALEDESLAVEAMDVGACEYLMKPVSIDTLKKVLLRFAGTL